MRDKRGRDDGNLDRYMEMEDLRDEPGPSKQRPSNTNLWPADFIDKFGSATLHSKEETLCFKELQRNNAYENYTSQTESQILWSTGMLAESIPDGFYSVAHEKKLKDLFDYIPTLDELSKLELEGLRADIILVDSEKDKKLSMLKRLIVTLTKGLGSNPSATIKKIAELVSDIHKRPDSDLSPAKSAVEESSHVSGNRGIQLVGQIRNGSCRPRAILFKVLADAIGLESKLMVGFPNEGAFECADSYKHMSVVVVLNSIELLVDLMRFPSQLIPRSTKAILMTHISAAGESDSAENDSCDSPLEPNSPLCGLSDRVDPESADKDESQQYQHRLEASLNAPGPFLSRMMLRSTSIDRNLSLSHSEPNIATTFWRRRRKKIISESRTTNSSPEQSSFRARGSSMLSGNHKSHRDYSDDIAASSYRSDGRSTSETRRLRRSISITPEIGDDIVRAVRAMNETLKQDRLLREQGNRRSYPHSSEGKNSDHDLQRSVSNFHLDGHDQLSSEISSLDALRKEHLSSQKAISLPSSPHEYRDQSARTSGTNDDMVCTWNKILESPMFQNKPLLPFQEWNIDYSELNVGPRVGIGSFGEVFRGSWNGTNVAIKVFLEQDLTAENMEDFCKEITILSRLRHPNASTKPPRLSVITEYMEMGSLYYLIHCNGLKKKLSWRRRLKMLCHVCRGLIYIHRMKIVHRDLKSANCLVNKHWMVKICDFGLSRMMIDTHMRDSSSAGTPEWMAPELIRNEPFTEKCDIFSFGVIMWELCTLSRPWHGTPPERVVYTVANEGARLEIPDPESPFGRLIADCWAEPRERPSCEDILTRLKDCQESLS